MWEAKGPSALPGAAMRMGILYLRLGVWLHRMGMEPRTCGGAGVRQQRVGLWAHLAQRNGVRGSVRAGAWPHRMDIKLRTHAREKLVLTSTL